MYEHICTLAEGIFTYLYICKTNKQTACTRVPGFSAGSSLRIPVKLICFSMNLDEPR